MTDFEGDFLTGYFTSIGDIGFLRRSNRLIREFITELRSHIDFQPGDDTDDKDDDDRSRDRSRDRFNVRSFLSNVVLDIEDAAVEQFAGQLNESDPLVQCIRQVIEVYILLRQGILSISPSLPPSLPPSLSLTHTHTYTHTQLTLTYTYVQSIQQ